MKTQRHVPTGVTLDLLSDLVARLDDLLIQLDRSSQQFHQDLKANTYEHNNRTCTNSCVRQTDCHLGDELRAVVLELHERCHQLALCTSRLQPEESKRSHTKTTAAGGGNGRESPCR
jgi:hypothetical protein